MHVYVCEGAYLPQWNMTSIITVLLRFNTELIQTDRGSALLHWHTSTPPLLLWRVCNFGLFHVCMVVYFMCVCVLPVLGESSENVIGNREGVTGGFTALYYSSLRFPQRTDYQRKRAAGENLRENMRASKREGE